MCKSATHQFALHAVIKALLDTSLKNRPSPKNFNIETMINIKTPRTGVIRKYRCKYIFGMLNVPLEKNHYNFMKFFFGSSTDSTYLSILFKMERPTSKPPITKNESTAMGCTLMNAAKREVCNHLPSVAKTLEFTFGNPLDQPKRWPSNMCNIAKVRMPERQRNKFFDLWSMLNNFVPFL